MTTSSPQPASSKTGGTAPQPADDTVETHPSKPTTHDDDVLESIGKAVSDPVKSAADDEEPGPDGKPRVVPGG